VTARGGEGVDGVDAGGLLVDVVVAPRDVTVRVDVTPGQTVALLGPNGAGKSTVLGVAAGLVEASSGTVALAGRSLVGVPPHRRRVALLAQEALLFPHLSVLDNVAFGPRSRGDGRSASRDVAHRWLARVGAEDLAPRRPGTLSGGQAQRVALARALAAEPLLLLLDEPLAALDVDVAPVTRQVLREVLADRTALLVTHDVIDALMLADHVVVLEDGRVVEEGPTREVLTRPRSTFAGRIAGLNVVPGRWDPGAVTRGEHRFHGRPDGVEPGPGEHVVAVFSPSAVTLVGGPAPDGASNTWTGRVQDVEPAGDRVRVRTRVAELVLTAELRASAAAAVDLAPGAVVHLSVPADAIAVHPAHRG
jgi:ABC-type sulfate/molybdate transport systems ATPase subunit